MLEFLIEKKDKGYILFTITRNEKRNAINYEVMEGLQKAINETAEAPDVKALVITGEGERAFCSGGDLSVFHSLSTKDEAYTMLSKMADILYSLTTLSKPTVALVNGTAIGGGCELASACDFRLGRQGIKAGFVQGKQAITTGWGGGSILAEKLPQHAAMKLLMEAEPQTVEYLFDLDFFHGIYEEESLSACEAFLDKTLASDVNVLESYKKIWINKWAAVNLRERMEEEVKKCAVLWESDAHHQYVKTFLNKN
ncbi:enoyl-CoA hydratase/isomerase family protein [Neobacillus mesonae]|uniref:enoyl-CoA hydratase/isomerase family protein n=1 Tax=Neobacillus mesonae TaxID=1193713 RepID=UPI002572A7DB|nr:enoyl-CoA hydratase/isomerase family protein [Neobacillus mesonae]MED4202694.1 enoyl-CoA hydratase/isomerase family protein [Neobacillus mesonae]